jgi:cell division protein FtsL
LVVVVVSSAIGVVYAKYASRKHFVELQSLYAQQELLDVEWGRLQLEEAALASQPKIEHTARGRLNMHLPDMEEIIVIKR